MATTKYFPALLIAAAMLFTGCIGSPVPIDDEPQLSVEDPFLGTWEAVDFEEDEGELLMEVLAFNDSEYYVEYTETDEDGSADVSRLRVFVSDVDGDQFINVQCIECDDRTWLFLKVELDADGLLLSPFGGQELDAAQKLFLFASDARKFVAAHRTDAEFFEEPARFRRVDQ